MVTEVNITIEDVEINEEGDIVEKDEEPETSTSTTTTSNSTAASEIDKGEDKPASGEA